MPKAERRTSDARVEPYPTIKPGDKPRSTSSTLTAASKSAASKTGTKDAKKALADKSAASVNIPPTPKTGSKSAKDDTAAADTPTTKDATKPSSAKKATPKQAALEDARGTASNFLEIKLDGEDTNSVPMHDTCATIRHKINDLLGKDNTKDGNGNPSELKKDGTSKPFTKASLARIFGCSGKALDTFLKAKKMMGGAESPVYPEAYKFFERKRIWEGKAKTQGRLKVEAE